jgi:hypothetical protein
MKTDTSTQIDHLVDNFDWHKVAETMSLMNWTWATTPNGGVPTVDELKAAARSLMENAVKQLKDSEPWTFAKSGGLSAWALRTESGVVVELSFEIASASGDWW